MYDEFQKADTSEKYKFQFPMAVFGTLRKLPNSHGNSYLMGRHENSIKTENNERRWFRDIADHKYYCHSRGYIRNVVPAGLSLHPHKDASGVVEVFFYNKNNWNQMIGNVDGLEGFDARSLRKYNSCYGYLRTLVEIHLLPKNFRSEFFDSYDSLSASRDLALAPQEDLCYPTIPAWIYSNLDTNRFLEKIQKTILWCGI
jgi:hypothetical protein